MVGLFRSRLVLIGLCCLLTSLNSFAQQILKDGEDPIRDLNTYLDLSQLYQQRSIDSSFYFNDKAHQIAKELHDDTLVAKVLLRRGTINVKAGEMEAAKNDYYKSISLYKLYGTEEQLYEALYSLGYFHYYQKQYDSSLYYFTKVRDFYEVNGNLNALAATELGIGTHYYYFKSDYRKALDYFNAAKEVFEKLEHPEGIAGAKIFAGLSYLKIDNLDSAEILFRQSLEVTSEAELDAKSIEALSYLASVLLKKGELLPAFQYSREALALAERTGIKQQQARLEASMVDMLLEYESTNSDLSEEHIDFLKSYGGMPGFILHAEGYVMEYGMLHSQVNLLKYLSRYYRENRDYSRAMDYQYRYFTLQDSLQNKVKLEAIAAIEEQYETAQKEKELIAARAEMQRISHEQSMERLYYGSTISIVLLLGVASFFYAQRNKARAQRQERESSLARAEAKAEKAEKEHVKRELELRDRELAAHALNIVRKNELINSIQEQLKAVKNPEVISIKRTLSNNWVQDKDWEHFNQSFNNTHPAFFDELHKLNPKLTNRDLRLAALIRLRMNNRDIANMLGINPASVDQAKYRLKKKLGLESEQNLETFLVKFTEKVA